MGSDDLFRKRKARSENSLKRQQATKENIDSILVICEDAKSSRNYVNWLLDKLRLRNNVKAIHPKKYHPSAIVDVAKKNIDRYTKIYCVFDRDNHASFSDAVDWLSSTGVEKGIFDAHSVPCFEYWLLLHYKDTTADMTSSQVERLLRNYLGTYDKSKFDLGVNLDAVYGSVEIAKERAHRSLTSFHAVGGGSYTKIFIMIKDFQKLADVINRNLYR